MRDFFISSRLRNFQWHTPILLFFACMVARTCLLR